MASDVLQTAHASALLGQMVAAMAGEWDRFKVTPDQRRDTLACPGLRAKLTAMLAQAGRANEADADQAVRVLTRAYATALCEREACEQAGRAQPDVEDMAEYYTAVQGGHGVLSRVGLRAGWATLSYPQALLDGVAEHLDAMLRAPRASDAPAGTAARKPSAAAAKPAPNARTAEPPRSDARLRAGVGDAFVGGGAVTLLRPGDDGE